MLLLILSFRMTNSDNHPLNDEGNSAIYFILINLIFTYMFKQSNLIMQHALFSNLLFLKRGKDRIVHFKFEEQGNVNLFCSRSKAIWTLVFAMSTIFASAQTGTNTITYQATGSAQTFTIPAGVTSLTVEAWGGGGAGGGGNTNVVRGGGGGGAYTKFPLTVSSGQVYTINVGQGGSGVSNPGGTGGSSNISLGNVVKVNAAGGVGAIGTSGSAGGNINAAVPTSGTGLVRFSGGNGGSGDRNGGGGGGSAGAGGNGGNGGNGDPGFFGFGASPGSGGSAGSGTGGNAGASGGEGGNRPSFAQGESGDSGSIPGAGGGGRASNTSISTLNGGAGGNGRIIISYIINTADLSITKTANTNGPAVGETVTFTIIAKNNRTNTVTDIVVTDFLPSGYTFLSSNIASYNSMTGKWIVGTLTSNATATLTLTALVKPSGDYNNTATILSETMPDDSTANNTATVNIIVCKAGATAPQVKTPVNP